MSLNYENKFIKFEQIIFIERQLNGKIKYVFSAKAGQHSSPGGWYFVSLPKAMAKEIRTNLQWQEEGWGRLKATAKIGKTDWETAIWFDTKLNTYALPLKSEVRKKEAINAGKIYEITIWV